MRKTILTLAVVIVGLFGVNACRTIAAEVDGDWPVDRRYRVAVDVAPSEPTVHQPFSTTIGFGALLKKAGVNEEFDPTSVVVTRRDSPSGSQSGRQTPIAHLMDEQFRQTDTRHGRLGYRLARLETILRLFRHPRSRTVSGDRDYGRPGRSGRQLPLQSAQRARDPMQTHIDPPPPIAADFDGDGRSRRPRLEMLRKHLAAAVVLRLVLAQRRQRTRSPSMPTSSGFMPTESRFNNGYNGIGLYDWDNDGTARSGYPRHGLSEHGASSRAGGSPMLDETCRTLPKARSVKYFIGFCGP